MHSSVLDLMYQRAGEHSERDAVATFRNGAWQGTSFEEIRRRAHRLSNHLIANGLERGDRVAIVSESSAEFGIVFFASARAGGCLVPLDPRLPEPELSALVANCEPKILFCSAANLELCKHLKEKFTFITELIVTDRYEIGGEQNEGEQSVSGINDGEHNHDEVKSIEQVSTHILQHGREREFDETALIVYTAGATGAPKGVMTSFGNLIFESEQLERLFDLSSDDVFLSILPMGNLLELTTGYLAVLYSGAQVCYVPDQMPNEVLRTIRLKKVSYMLVVPSFLQVLSNQLVRLLSKKNEKQLRTFRIKLGVAKLLPQSLRKLLFPTVHKLFGPQFRGFICTGAPLAPRTARLFDCLGISVCQGYSLTETSSLISINDDSLFRLGSAGHPIDGVEVQISNQPTNAGEILVRGPNVTKGYYKNEELTVTAIDADGWLHTGDVGRIDDDGFLFVTGRLKDLIEQPGGNKVQPEEVEAVLAASEFVKEVCVVGIKDATMEFGEVVAVVVPKKSGRSYELAARQNLDTGLNDLPFFKRPSRIIFVEGHLPRTHTGKLKRSLVPEWLAAHGVSR